jgi:protein HIRA/HIR1
VSFFRRLSWSPEGSCIATANGENSGLCIAPIVNRDGWNADVFLVGHQAPIEVVVSTAHSCFMCFKQLIIFLKAFNPVIFEIPASHADKSKKTISAVCAVGSQDNSISIWWTSKARSVAVAKHVFSYSVLDLSWTSEGLCLFACSYDGSTAALMFEDGEFGVPLAGEEKV